jgi:DcuC family C4-dicarboxylate transporter
LIKRWETRLVLITAGLFLCVVSMNPMAGLNAFASSMTKGGLIMSICSAMGFAYVMSYTKCDSSLVHYLATPIRGLGIFLIPVCTAITFFVNIAIPSAAGCSAAVRPGRGQRARAAVRRAGAAGGERENAGVGTDAGNG